MPHLCSSCILKEPTRWKLIEFQEPLQDPLRSAPLHKSIHYCPVVCCSLRMVLVCMFNKLWRVVCVRLFQQQNGFALKLKSLGSVQLWQSVAKLLSDTKPDAVVLVHRLPSFATEHACASQRAGSAENVLTGLSSHQAIDQTLLQHDISSRNRDILAGKVGDCCEDEHELNQILPFSRQHPDPLPATDRTRSGAHTHDSEQTMDHWGLVVQSKYTSEAEGCYVLKTVRNTNPVGCQCTHYSLTRLCSPARCKSK